MLRKWSVPNVRLLHQTVCLPIFSKDTNMNLLVRNLMMTKEGQRDGDGDANRGDDRYNSESSRDESGNRKREMVMDLGNQSQIVYMPTFLSSQDSWNYLHYLDNNIPWTRPTIRVFGRSVLQPRDTCYVVSAGVTELEYSGYKPQAYSWDDFPLLKDILEAVHKSFPESSFNSLLLNRYKDGDDHVGWHADDEKLYGPTPEIASISFGCERDFLLKKRPNKKSEAKRTEAEPPSKRPKKNPNQHSFALKHGSLLLMRGYTQRDWLHSVPKRSKAGSVRINLTFRRVL